MLCSSIAALVSMVGVYKTGLLEESSDLKELVRVLRLVGTLSNPWKECIL